MHSSHVRRMDSERAKVRYSPGTRSAVQPPSPSVNESKFASLGTATLQSRSGWPIPKAGPSVNQRLHQSLGPGPAWNGAGEEGQLKMDEWSLRASQVVSS